MKKRQRIRKTIIIICFLLFPVTIFYFSPFLIVLGAIDGIVAGSMIMFGLLFVSSLVFGKLACAYVCPVGGLQECLMPANDKKAKGGWRNYIKWILWIPWVAAIIWLFIRADGISEVDFFFHTTDGVSLDGSQLFTYGIYYGIILLIVIPALMAGRRAFCHYICWIKPFMVIGDRFARMLRLPVLRLRADATACIECGRCDTKCPMSLDVKEMVKSEKMASDECILCGECIDICPKKVINYSFRNKSCSCKKN